MVRRKSIPILHGRASVTPPNASYTSWRIIWEDPVTRERRMTCCTARRIATPHTAPPGCRSRPAAHSRDRGSPPAPPPPSAADAASGTELRSVCWLLTAHALMQERSAKPPVREPLSGPAARTRRAPPAARGAMSTHAASHVGTFTRRGSTDSVGLDISGLLRAIEQTCQASLNRPRHHGDEQDDGTDGYEQAPVCERLREADEADLMSQTRIALRMEEKAVSTYGLTSKRVGNSDAQAAVE